MRKIIITFFTVLYLVSCKKDKPFFPTPEEILKTRPSSTWYLTKVYNDETRTNIKKQYNRGMVAINILPDGKFQMGILQTELGINEANHEFGYGKWAANIILDGKRVIEFTNIDIRNSNATSIYIGVIKEITTNNLSIDFYKAGETNTTKYYLEFVQ